MRYWNVKTTLRRTNADVQLGTPKSVEFTEIKGRQLRLPTSIGVTQGINLANETVIEGMQYADTPVVLMTESAKDALRFVRRHEVSKCQALVYCFF